jgi:hypothetical protein
MSMTSNEQSDRATAGLARWYTLWYAYSSNTAVLPPYTKEYIPLEGNAISEFLDQFTNLFAITAIGFGIAYFRLRQDKKMLQELYDHNARVLKHFEKENEKLKKKLKALTKASKEEVANE